MYLYKLHCFIRCEAEGNPTKAVLLCQSAGFDQRITDMIVHSANWREDVDGFHLASRVVANAEDLGHFWPGVAYEHLGAISTARQNRIEWFEAARDEAFRLTPNPADQAYILMCANAGLLDTEGGPHYDDLANIVMWMTDHGVYNAPGRAAVLVQQLLTQSDPQEALKVYARIVHRKDQPDAYFSPRQFAHLKDVIGANFSVR